MVVAGDIEAVSIPFAAGTVLAAFLSSIPFFWDTHIIVSAISLCLSALSLLLICRSGGGRGSIIPTFVLLGFFCFLSYSSIPLHSGPHPFFGRCASALQATIDGIPFSDRVCNALLKALLSGDRSGLDRKVSELFRASGASHILALSGLHLGIIYTVISKILSLFGNSPLACKIRSLTIIGSSGFFTLMSGGNPSTVRAWLFISLGEIAACDPEREKNPLRVLLTALTIQLLFKPTVVTELGFQLSYLAMCGIFLVHPLLESFYPDDGPAFNPLRRIWTGASLSISCQLFTAPLVWMRFKTFPRFFLICNLLAMPLTTAIMVSALATSALSGLGICPEALVNCTGFLVKSLLKVLEIICSM